MDPQPTKASAGQNMDRKLSGMRAPLTRRTAAAGIAAVVLCSLFLSLTLPVRAQFGAKKEEPGFQSGAPYAILIDAASGNILYEKGADTLIPPASILKLMTAEVVFNEIKQGNIKLSDEYTISEDAWRRGGAPSRTSSMFAPIHSKVSVDNLLHSVIIQSGNDACIALAEGIAGNEDAFARLMTGRARELGLEKSTFGNSTGLPNEGNQVTVREMAKLAQHIIKTYPNFYSYFSIPEFTWNKIRQYNRNPLLKMNIGADGMKTGYIKESGYGVVGSAVRDGLRLIVVVHGLKTAKDRADEAKKLLDYGFNAFAARPLFAAGQVVAEAKVYGGDQGSVQLVSIQPIQLLLQRKSDEKLIARVVYTGPVRAPVRKGQEIGELKVWRDDKLSLVAPLVADQDVPVGSISQRAFDAATELVIGVFRAGIDRL
jgi:D-alanyl-D-alanine carboxypeptidase (penicillin-binding protein 5/6)